MSEKTVGEWLEELPEPYRTAAISQAVLKKKTASSIRESIGVFTQWDETKEGSDFWYAVYNHFCEPNDLPPYPEEYKKEKLKAEIESATIEIHMSIDKLIKSGIELAKEETKQNEN